MKRSSTVYPLLISLLSLTAIWFYLCFLASRIETTFADVGGRGFMLGNSPFLDLTLGSWRVFLSFLWVPCLITLALFLPPWFQAVPERIRRWARYLLYGWSLLLLLTAGWCMVAGCAGASMTTMAGQMKLRIYERVLEEFSLREAAEARHEEINQRMKALVDVRPVLIQSADELSPQDRRDRVSTMLGMLQKEKSETMNKRILATLLMFRADIRAGSSQEESLLKAAQKATGKPFGSAKEFFDWLQSHVGQGEWEPIPVYKFVPK